MSLGNPVQITHDEYVQAALAGDVVRRETLGEAAYANRWDGLIALYPDGECYTWRDGAWHVLVVLPRA